MIKIGVLLTCYNRKNKTLACLSSLYKADKPENINFDVFVTDDKSSDGTKVAVKKSFPLVKIIDGTGELFWAGGIRNSWSYAMSEDKYDVFLLLNDDVELHQDFFKNFISTNNYSISKFGKVGIYSSATIDRNTRKISYGGNIIKNKLFRIHSVRITPTKIPQSVHTANANILWIDKSVVQKIGILDDRYVHGIADYDYALRANKNNIPVLLTMGIGGLCDNDHGNNWLDNNATLKERINYLMSPLGLSYKNYLLYIKTHFPTSLPYSFTMIWLKTITPFFWRLKK